MQEQSETSPLLEDLKDDYENRSIKLKPITRDRPKIRRNDKCPCGSGKKFKYCCKD